MFTVIQVYQPASVQANKSEAPTKEQAALVLHWMLSALPVIYYHYLVTGIITITGTIIIAVNQFDSVWDW